MPSFNLTLKVPCPFCKAKIPSDSLRCRHCAADLSEQKIQEQIGSSIKRKRIVILAVIALIVLPILVFYIAGNSPPSQTGQQAAEELKMERTPQVSQGPDFNVLAQQRFANIAKGFSGSELGKISCLHDDCRYAQVYFDFKILPDDLDMIIRGNAATFSKFMKDSIGLSDVTVTARLGG